MQNGSIGDDTRPSKQIEKEIIEFTQEEEENDILPVLDLKQKLNRKTKQF